MTCTSADPDLKIKITPTFLDPNIGAIEHLKLTVKKSSENFGDRINYETWIKRKRTSDGFEYIGLLDKTEVSLKINSKTLITNDVKTDLNLNQNRMSEKKFKDLVCSVTGVPFPPYADCPKAEELNSLLLKASRGYNLETIQNLLACGADPSVKDEKGCSPLLNLATIDCGKGTPYEWGYVTPRPGINGDELVETIDAMISQGAFIDEKDPVNQRTALQYFTITQTDRAIKGLLDFEADVNSQDIFGNTPLMYAVSTGNGILVQNLNDGRPNLGLKNKEGKTAYDIAQDRNFRHLLPYLGLSTEDYVIQGQDDGTCTPLNIHIKSGIAVTFILKASASKMFMLKIPNLDVELMAMSGKDDRKTVTVPQGKFSFTCGVHGGQESQGQILTH